MAGPGSGSLIEGAAMLHRYGTFVTRRARILLVLAGIFLIAAGYLGTGAFGKLKNGGFQDPQAESTRAERLIDAQFGGGTNLVLLVTAKNGTVDGAAAAAAGRRLTQALSGEAGVSGIASYWSTGAPDLRSTDGRQALVVGHLAGDQNQVLDRSKELFAAYAGDRGPVTVLAGGTGGISQDVNTQVTRSLAIAESIAVPLTLLLLVLAFGSLVAALLPLAIGGVAIMGTLAELAILGSVTDVSIFAINLTTALGLGLGIDYALFMVSRFREQLGKGDSVPEAVARTVATAGRTVIFSAAAVIAALAAMLVFPLYFLRSFAYAGMGVVAIAAIGALVVLPALLAVLGRRVNAGRLPWSAAARGAEAPLWGRLAGAVMRHPGRTALPVLALLLVVATPLLGVSFGTPDQTVLPRSAGSRQVADALVDRFPGNSGAPIDVVATGPVAPAPLAEYARRLSALPGVAMVQTSAGAFTHGAPVGAQPAGTGAAAPANPALGGPGGQRLTVITSVAGQSAQAQDLVRAIRAMDGPGGGPTLVSGAAANLIDTSHVIGARLPLAIALVVLTTFLVLFLFTGSVVQPVRALLLNALSLGATLGVLTWIFQNGHLAGLLGFTPRPMDMAMTVLLFCITFGLSMDYEMFVMSRVKELHDQGAPAATAVSTGLARTGRIVSTAASLLAVTFFAFGTGTVSFLQMFGIGSGIAILIDATLIRGVLVPAAMRVLGRTAWYAPPPLRWVHARVALREA
jgi:putative drug exporter of the RND superfamily